MDNAISASQPQTDKNSKVLRIIIWGIFVIYILVLLKIILFKNVNLEQFLSGNIGGYHAYNLIPFLTIHDFISMGSISFGRVFSNIFGNILVFMPLGYFLPLLMPRFKKFWKVLLISIGLSVVFEISQYVFMLGSLDIDDVILNTLGGAIGYGLYAVFSRIFSKRKSFYKFTVISVSFAACFAVTALLALPYMNFGTDSDVDYSDGGMVMVDSNGYAYTDESGNNENTAYGYVDKISSNIITINIIEVKNLGGDSSVASSDVGSDAPKKNIYVDNSTQYAYKLIDTQGRILENRKGGKSDIKPGVILEVEGSGTDDRFVANTVHITEVE